MKIWIDFNEPKTVIMLRDFVGKYSGKHEFLFTARDFDSTVALLGPLGIDYSLIGKHGHALNEKLQESAKRVLDLIPVVKGAAPDCLFSLASPDAVRVAFGFQIPIVLFNDEPRSYGTCKLTLSLANKVVVPRCIPVDWYTGQYAIKESSLSRFNGIDEVAWIPGHESDPRVPKNLGLEPGQYIISRTEPTKASYLIDEMHPHETKLTEIIPGLLESNPSFKHVVITRNEEQQHHLSKFFKSEIEAQRVQVHRALTNLVDLLDHAALVLSGGGTMTREAPLLGVPSIEFFPGQTYPQEQFLMDHGFPLDHVKAAPAVLARARQLLEEPVGKENKQSWKDRAASFEDPVNVGYKHLLECMEERHPDLK